MSAIRVDRFFGPRRIGPTGGDTPEAQPAGVANTIAAHEAQYGPKLDAAEAQAETLRQEAATLKAEARKLKGDEKKTKLAQANEKLAHAREVLGDAESLYVTDLSRISGTRGRDLLLRAEARKGGEAGRAVVAATNATLWTIGFGYGTHKAREAYLTDVPADGKVSFTVICSPSGHVGNAADGASYRRNLDNFARTNRYVAEIWHRAPDGSMRRLQSNRFGVNNPPEYATASPELTVDVSQLKGALVMRGWAEGSAGIGGYVEARETVVHLA